MEFNYDYLQTLQGGITVRFPSDHLSPKALMQRNSPCRVYRLGKPMSAGQFRSLPRDLRRMYLQRLRSRGASAEDVRRMLELSPADLQQLLQECRVTLDQPDPAAWSRFLQL